MSGIDLTHESVSYVYEGIRIPRQHHLLEVITELSPADCQHAQPISQDLTGFLQHQHSRL